MPREIGKLRLVMPGITAGLTKMWVEYQIEDDDDMKERADPLKFRGTDFTKTAAELWEETKAAIATKENL